MELRGFDEGSSILNRRLWQYAVAEVQDVPNRPALIEDFFCLGIDPFLRSKQHARIQIALDRDAIACTPAGFCYGNSPVNAKDIRARRCH